jgi:heptosyltransferase I
MAALRILAIRLSSMGDVIHTLPAVATLKNSFPESHITWTVRPRWASLLEGNPYVDEVMPVDRSFSASWDRASRLRRRRVDVAIDFQGLIQTALLGAAVMPKKFVGFDWQHVREGPASWVYTSRVAIRTEHVVDQNMELAAAAGATKPLPAFPLPEGKAEGTLPEGKFILASPFAGWGSKQWPIDRWMDLASQLDLPLVVNGPPGTERQLSEILGAHVHVSGIPGLIHATRRAHAVIGLDSGPMHLAAALTKPGVAIFGPTDPARNGAYGNSMRTIRVPSAATTYKRSPEPAESMKAVSAQMVLEALSASLSAQVAGSQIA